MFLNVGIDRTTFSNIYIKTNLLTNTDLIDDNGFAQRTFLRQSNEVTLGRFIVAY